MAAKNIDETFKEDEVQTAGVVSDHSQIEIKSGASDKTSELFAQKTDKPPLHLTICPLKQLSSKVGQIVDLLAVITKVYPLNEITAKDGRHWTKRAVTLVDQAGTQMTFTFWFEHARQIEEEQVLNQVIGIKGARVKGFRGKFSVGTVPCTRWELNPKNPQVAGLVDWHKRNFESG